MAGFFKNLFKQEENPGWGKALLGGAMQGIGSGQGMLSGAMGGAFGKLMNKGPSQQAQDMSAHLAGSGREIPGLGLGLDKQEMNPMSSQMSNTSLLSEDYPGNNNQDMWSMRRRQQPYLKY